MKVKARPTKKQYDVLEALKEKDVVFFGGGAGGGKSWLICESRLIKCYQYPGYKSFIGREELKRLMQSTYITFEKVCQFHKIPRDDWKLNGQYNYIEFKNGSRIDLLDLKYNPSDPLFERLGSLEFTDGAIEEAGEVHSLAYDVLKSRIGRHLNKEEGIKPTLLITGNPKKNWTYHEFYKPHKDKKLPDNIGFIQSLYNDNPHTATEYGKQLSSIKDKETKERLMFGNWEYDDDPNTLIGYEAIIDLFTNNVDEEGKYITADIARYGDDKTVIGIWNGWKCKLKEYTKQGIDQTILELERIAKEERVPYSHILADEDGVGGGVIDGMRGIKGFVNNSRALEGSISREKENFQNLKTQCYYHLSDKINDKAMSVEVDNEDMKNRLIGELEVVKQKDADKDAPKKILSKDEVKELIGRSPDLSDTLMMRMWFDLKRISPFKRQAKTFIPQSINKI